MFRAAPRLIARPASLRVAIPRPATRYLSTAPPTQKSRSWKNLVARLGIAGAIIYYYNTNDLFEEEPSHPAHAVPTPESNLPTIESITAEREKRRAVQAQLDAQRRKEEEEAEAAAAVAAAAKTQDAASGSQENNSEGGLEGLEEEAGQQGAFNPETGEINWDCPCLGGMAHGPCGEEFKTAFSCFVFSQEEPKGMDCIDKFKNMQNCFRQYPEVYGSELESDADDDVEAEADDLSADVSSSSPTSSVTDAEQPKPTPTERPQTTERAAQAKTSPQPSSKPHSPEKVTENRRELGLVPENYRPKEEPVNESETLVPKAAHDASDAKPEGEGNKAKLEEKK